VSVSMPSLYLWALSALLTDNHHVEAETFANTLAVPLVWKIGKADVSGELPPDNVLVVISSAQCAFESTIYRSRNWRWRGRGRRSVRLVSGRLRPSKARVRAVGNS